MVAQAYRLPREPWELCGRGKPRERKRPCLEVAVTRDAGRSSARTGDAGASPPAAARADARQPRPIFPTRRRIARPPPPIWPRPRPTLWRPARSRPRCQWQPNSCPGEPNRRRGCLRALRWPRRAVEPVGRLVGATKGQQDPPKPAESTPATKSSNVRGQARIPGQPIFAEIAWGNSGSGSRGSSPCPAASKKRPGNPGLPHPSSLSMAAMNSLSRSGPLRPWRLGGK